MYANFLLGTLIVSEDAAALLGRTPLDLIARHAVNDHGVITQQEDATNRKSMRGLIGCPITSRFPVDPTDLSKGQVLVVTDAWWESTTVKLESEA